MKNDRKTKIREKKAIILPGPLTIQKIVELKDVFSEAFPMDTEIVIDHSASEEFDFSYLQLLYSAYITLKRKKINLSIASNNPLLFDKLYKESGFDSTALAAILQLSKEEAEGRA